MFLGSISYGGNPLVHESFENTTGSYVSGLVGSTFSSSKPFAGAFHLLGETNQFKITVQVPTYGNATNGFILSCYIDPKSEAKELFVTLGHHKQSVHIENNVFGYRQVLMQLPYDGKVLPELNLTVTGGGKHFLMDDLEVTPFGSTLPVRPEPTQVIANVNGISRDMISSLSLNSKKIDLFHGIAADGYSLLHDVYTLDAAAEELILQIEPSLTDVTYALGVWVDSNLNGVYEESERNSSVQVSGKSTIVLPTSLFLGEAVPVRVRLLDKRVSTNMTAQSGNTWGQTLELLVVKTTDQSHERCACATPDYYLDLSGKKLSSLDGVSPGIYIRKCGNTSEKIWVSGTSE
jgi:hypothetical protein